MSKTTATAGTKTTTKANAGTKATKVEPAKGRTLVAWTTGAPVSVVQAMRDKADKAGINAGSVADLALTDASLEAVPDLQAHADALAPAVWAYVAAAFGGTLPRPGQGSRQEQAARAEIVGALVAAGISQDAARKRVQRYRWAGLLQAHPAMRGKSVQAIRTMSANESDARETVTTGEAVHAQREGRAESAAKAKAEPKAAPKVEGGTVTPQASDRVTIDALTDSAVLALLDAVLASVQGRKMVQSDRQRLATVLRAHGLQPVPKAEPVKAEPAA